MVVASPVASATRKSECTHKRHYNSRSEWSRQGIKSPKTLMALSSFSACSSRSDVWSTVSLLDRWAGRSAAIATAERSETRPSPGSSWPRGRIQWIENLPSGCDVELEVCVADDYADFENFVSPPAWFGPTGVGNFTTPTRFSWITGTTVAISNLSRSALVLYCFGFLKSSCNSLRGMSDPLENGPEMTLA